MPSDTNVYVGGEGEVLKDTENLHLTNNLDNVYPNWGFLSQYYVDWF